MRVEGFVNLLEELEAMGIYPKGFGIEGFNRFSPGGRVVAFHRDGAVEVPCRGAEGAFEGWRGIDLKGYPERTLPG